MRKTWRICISFIIFFDCKGFPESFMADAVYDLLFRRKRTDENLKDVIVLMTTLIFHRRVVSISEKTSASDSSMMMMRIISFQPIRADLMRNKVSLPILLLPFHNSDIWLLKLMSLETTRVSTYLPRLMHWRPLQDLH